MPRGQPSRRWSGRGNRRARGSMTEAIPNTPELSDATVEDASPGPSSSGNHHSSTPRFVPGDGFLTREGSGTGQLSATPGSYSTNSLSHRSRPPESTVPITPGISDVLSQAASTFPSTRDKNENAALDDAPQKKEPTYSEVLNAQKGPFAQIGCGTATVRSRSVVTEAFRAVTDSKYFRWGVIFKMLWYETEGVNISRWLSISPRPRKMPETNPVDKYVVEVRFLMVVARYATHCICAPIHTYNGKGCSKRGMKDSEIKQHAIIHDKNREAVKIEDEDPNNIMLDSIPMHVNDGEDLDEMSRIRFDQLCTVTHNIRIQEVGWVHSSLRKRISGHIFDSMQLGKDNEDSWEDDEWLGGSCNTQESE